ncbi:putative uncharacterized protein DDB_G0277255 isoform X2 [Teleopsis dalmanni]|nr:putative uncharacterized protein DDB_G0277255 isoform X2 [Teleopsis dalmanni]XP_037952191.1 putative uncharacterized protein DDB_G0277255 isoform X2 [Teleopsis dalmanni]XP_037952192.1 putative uncharacterized protein DDB_G0277255 isoform X2 [Teleopsis dalmanni]
MYTTTTSSTSSYHHSHHTQNYAKHTYVGPGNTPQRQSIGVAVLPTAMNRSFFSERQKLRSVGDSSQDLDSSGNGSGSNIDSNNAGRTNDNNSGGEMSDSQRSLSEGRLVDSDYNTQDQLSQSHDSVFSESATASSLSSVLKAELADVLRKRRNRPDASDEDLGLPRSPASPQRRAEQQRKSSATVQYTTTPANVSNNSELCSLSLLSMTSTDCDDFSNATSTNISNSSVQSIYRHGRTDLLRRSTSDSFGITNDEVDLFDSNWQRLSHAAAKHKMAVRPTKKKGPSRHHRRTLETSIPEAIEETPKTYNKRNLDCVDDAKAKTRSLPPGVNTKLLDQHAEETKYTANTISASTAITAQSSGSLVRNSKSEKIQEVNTSATSTTNTATSSTMFGLRALTAKANSLFDTKEIVAPTHNDNIVKKQETEHMATLETAESGFLRRLMQRNSKRSISKMQSADEVLDSNESIPKKLQISISNIDTTERLSSGNGSAMKKSRSATNYVQNVEETRKEIKREIVYEGANGLNAMMNSFPPNQLTLGNSTAARETPINQAHKPKSGPAARQRYLPQDIEGEKTLERKTAETKADNLAATAAATTSNPLSVPTTSDTFQSTSIIREIRASQLIGSNESSPKKLEHYEKKPKIVGLSAFQQKISRSNDAVARASTNSLESVSGGEINYRDFEQKQRKLVEKSRSFRTYNENRETTTSSNMPSLPDLSLNLNLSVPTYNEFIMKEKAYHGTPSPPDKSVSLGFEINDNNLIKPNTIRTNSAHNVSLGHTKSVVVPSAAGLLAPNAGLPQISPTNSCNMNINEIEQNIDMIVTSPFVSVLRKSAVYNDNPLESLINSEQVIAAQSYTKVPSPQKTRPKVLELKGCTADVEEKMTPTTAAVPLREKIIISNNATTVTSDKATTKEILERKSAPVTTGNKTPVNIKSIKRNMSLTDTAADDIGTHIPEFMKIQLNRVDPARMAKTNIVLAKNIKETSPSKDIVSSKSSSMDDLSTRRDSNESVEINKRTSKTPTSDTSTGFTGITEAVNRQAHSNISNSNQGFIVNSNSPPHSNDTFTKIAVTDKQSNTNKSCNEAVKQSTAISPTTVTTPTAFNHTNMTKQRNNVINNSTSNGASNNGSLDSKRSAITNSTKATSVDNSINQNNFKIYSNGNSDLPPKSPVKKTYTPQISSAGLPSEEHLIPSLTTEDGANRGYQTLTDMRISLQHRKRLFLQEEQAQTVRKIEEIRNERKKSINDEVVFRKSITKSEERPENIVSSPTKSEPNLEQTVMLRKKSFGATSNSSIPISQFNNNSSGNSKEDGTPELIKVFARRSLKVKDEDISALAEKIMQNNGNAVASTKIINNNTTNGNSTQVNNLNSNGNTLKKLQQHSSQLVTQQQNVDSDKENHSASEEKLDKLSKPEVNVERETLTSSSKTVTTSNAHANNSNRNSVADFRNGGPLNKNGLTVHNNNNNNNGNTTTSAGPTNKSALPVARSFRAISSNMSVTSIGNNNNSVNTTSKGTLERKSMNYLKPAETHNISTSTSVGGSKAIERSATVSEFKGIHQRRAEWEQRAKEAFK